MGADIKSLIEEIRGMLETTPLHYADPKYQTANAAEKHALRSAEKHYDKSASAYDKMLLLRKKARRLRQHPNYLRSRQRLDKKAKKWVAQASELDPKHGTNPLELRSRGDMERSMALVHAKPGVRDILSPRPSSDTWKEPNAAKNARKKRALYARVQAARKQFKGE